MSKTGKTLQCVRCGEIAGPGKRNQIAQVDGFDGDGARDLTCKLPPTIGLGAIPDDEDAALTVRRTHARSLQAPRMVFGPVQLDPGYAVWRCPEVNRLAAQQIVAYVEQPVAERFRIRI